MESYMAVIAEKAPPLQLSGAGTSMLSAIQTADGDEAFIQELEQENGNHILNDEPDDDLNECQEDTAEAEVDCDEDYFFPSPDEVEQTRTPEVGMVFATLEDAHRFVNVYGQVTGFVVFKGRNYKHKKITLQCNKSKKAKENEIRQRKRKRNAIERTGCPMSLTVKLVAGKWEITAVQNEHNHPLSNSPSLTRFFLSHKYMSEEERNFSRILQETKIKPAKIMQIFRKLRGKFKNIPVSKMAVSNLEQFDRLMKTENTDIECALEHLRRLQKEQPGFYYAIKTDGDNTVRSIFWTDAQARLDYALYGDFISFYTSYTTIEYDMLFALVIGMNGYSKTTVFGWALLEDGRAETFSWLFRTFLDVMDGKKPNTILTHQDSDITKSIAEVFHTAFHRFDMWHVMRKATDELRSFMAHRAGMETEVTHLVTNSLATEEFENGWQAMLEKYDAASNAHLDLMYQTRLMWVPVYFKHVFSPFTRSTRCSMSKNSIFKDYVQQNDTIETFISQYDIFQEAAVSIEDGDRFESTLKKPTYSTRHPIERHAAEIYTMGMFLRFQKELLDASAFNAFEKEKDVMYTVKKALDYEDAEFLRDSFSVEVDLKTNTFNCICSKFERDGIVCCHVLRLFTQFSINKIPEHYIKPRWTKKFREQELQKYCSEKIGSAVSQSTLRYAMIMNRMADSCATVSKDLDRSKIFLEEHERILQKLTERE
ncbi:protein FAR1-RELATED SEQUENCE 5-like [Panicum virgatum]|uniref:protein FAR1-RELATED SEQUENCE 5-like n=1 Tax=Panicum virgatum TaxID=38727 RepID=UPI0019D5B21E|nr:protein FAR1-RELATED SEQUENCE 5-like [Panicum virgatum]